MSDMIMVGDAMRHAYKMCETDNQRRGVERAASAVAKAYSDKYPGFGRVAFMDWVKGKRDA